MLIIMMIFDQTEQLSSNLKSHSESSHEVEEDEVSLRFRKSENRFESQGESYHSALLGMEAVSTKNASSKVEPSIVANLLCLFS